MKRLLLSFIFLMSLCFADENSGFFIGVETGFSKGVFVDKDNLTISKLDENGDYVFDKIKDISNDSAFKFGYRFSKMHRIYTSIGYGKRFNVNSRVITPTNTGTRDYTYKSKTFSLDFALGYDFTPSLTQSIKGLLGFYGGYSSFNMQNQDLVIRQNSIDSYIYKSIASGFLYGLKAGFILDLSINNEIELSARYTQRRYKQALLNPDELAFKPTTKDLGIYLGYAYKF